MSFQRPAGYAGDLSVEDAYSVLTKDDNSVLVDVRTKAEWTFVGVPDLSQAGKAPIFLEWQVYPSMQVAADFAPRLVAELTARSVDRSAPVVFLCRSGGRSRAAAAALTSAGWPKCYNIVGGFEGDLDEARRRGRDGWRAKGLPWIQS
jgi:rhodanese-related sulfurtransferase